MARQYPECTTVTQRVALSKNEDGFQTPALNGLFRVTKINLPLKKSVWLAVFAWLSTNPYLSLDKKAGRAKRVSHVEALTYVHRQDDAARVPTMSPSTLGQYKSAVKWLHSERDLAFVAEADGDDEAENLWMLL